jgi:hypothetical protein
VFERRAASLGTACLLSVVMDGLAGCHRRVARLQGSTAGSLSQRASTTASSTRQFRVKINAERVSLRRHRLSTKKLPHASRCTSGMPSEQ